METADRLLWMRRLALTTVGMTLLLMALGAWVKANGAGLACPDWPQCYGDWFPPFPSSENGGTWQGEPVAYTESQVLYEWAHRAVVALILVPLAAYAWLGVKGRELHPALRFLPAGALGVYFFQAFLGAVTVKTGNPAWATTAHLVTAASWLTLLTVAACFAFLRPRPVGEATHG